MDYQSLHGVHLGLTFWEKTSGTWINVATIVLGTTCGVILHNSLPKRIQQIITQGLGLFTLFLGLTMASSMLKVNVGKIDGILLGLLAIVIGGIGGELMQIEAKLEALGNLLKRTFRGGGQFTEGFVAASLLFGVGPMAIVGCLNNGLSGNANLLTVKSVMDGLASIAFSSSYGIGVGFSSLPILLYQGGLSLAAGLFSQTLVDPNQNPIVQLVAGVGGLIVMGIGINLLEIRKINVSAFLPALFIAPLILTIAARIG
jgi:uncharacterized protein